jgi:hypothetical protein
MWYRGSSEGCRSPSHSGPVNATGTSKIADLLRAIARNSSGIEISSAIWRRPQSKCSDGGRHSLLIYLGEHLASLIKGHHSSLAFHLFRCFTADFHHQRQKHHVLLLSRFVAHVLTQTCSLPSGNPDGVGATPCNMSAGAFHCCS